MSPLPTQAVNPAAPANPTKAAHPAQAAALQRLALSRAGLRSLLIAQPDPDDAMAGAPPQRLLRQLWRQLRRAARASPAADLALGALQAWWLTRPWRPALTELRHNMDTSVLPLVRRHPWAAVGVAAGAGAVLVYLRPWRWAGLRNSWPLWRAGLVAQLVQQAAHWPWEAMLGALFAALASRRPAPPEAPAPSESTGAADQARPPSAV
jgi:hypothetical protein